MDTVLEYRWEAQVDGQPLSDREFLELSQASEPLLNWQNKWVLLDPQDMETLKPIFQQKNESKFGMAQHGELNYFEALKLGMLGEVQL